MKVRFHARYDHTWPSRAMTCFPAGYEGTVKREVGELAIAKGRATLVGKNATALSDGKATDETCMARCGSVAGRDHDDDVGTGVFTPNVAGAGK